MSYQSTEAAAFQSTVEGWLDEKGEVSALVRFSSAAGNKEFRFFQSCSSFRDAVAAMRPETCVTVFREKQLPLRGRVTPEVIEEARRLLGEADEYLIAGLDPVPKGGRFRCCEGEGWTELVEDLSGCLGERVAVGPYPPWLVDSDGVISAVVPRADGSVVTGVY